MRKLVFIAAILFFALAATNCKRTTTLATQEATVTHLDSLLEGKQFNKEAFCAIMQQLNLDPDKCYWQFVSEQILPENNKLSIWVIPMINQMDEDGSYTNLSGYILLADGETGEIKSKYYEKDAWTSDAIQLTNISIDTLGYRLSDNKLVFGIHASYNGSSNVCPGGNTSLRLFAQQGNELSPIFEYDSNKYSGENDGGAQGNGNFEEHDTELVVTKQSSNDFYDFALLTNTRWDVQKNNETKSTYSIRDSIRLFSYTGKEYKEVTESSTSVVYTEHMGESEKGDWFYYGKTLAQAYTLLWEERNKLSQSQGWTDFLKKEMPQENLEYKILVSEEETDVVNYTYENDKCLIVDKESELGSARFVITEKKRYTQISSWITD